jgi:hypothetical protein
MLVVSSRHIHARHREDRRSWRASVMLQGVGIDARGKLEEDPFRYRATRSGKVLICRGDRQVSVVAGKAAEKLLTRLAATESAEVRQLLLAKATGNYRHGNERIS